MKKIYGAFVILILSSCTWLDTANRPDKVSISETTVSKFGDVSNRKAEAIPEQDEEYIAPSVKELRRMKEFLETNVPKVGIMKVLKTPWGETIDCVDILKQPALLKQDMKGHEVKVKPMDSPDLRSLIELMEKGKDTKLAE